jgi:hypothetical protein
MIALFDNRRMAAITGLQLAQYGKSSSRRTIRAVRLRADGRCRHGVKALHGGTTRAELEAALAEAYAHDGLSLVHIPVYAGEDPIAGMGAYGSWNVGNWVDDVQARYLKSEHLRNAGCIRDLNLFIGATGAGLGQGNAPGHRPRDRGRLGTIAAATEADIDDALAAAKARASRSGAGPAHGTGPRRSAGWPT